MKRYNILIEYLFLLFFIALVPLSSAQSENDCILSYYFIISHLNSENNLIYSELDLIEFSERLSLEENTTRYYISNYSDVCLNITNLSIPKPESKQSGELKRVTLNCENKINKKFIGYDMDLSFPLPDFILGDSSCPQVEFYKWFLDIESDGINYYMDGIKLWILLFLVIIILTIFIAKSIKSISKTDRAIENFTTDIRDLESR